MDLQLIDRFSDPPAPLPILHYVELYDSGNPVLLLLHGVARNWLDWEGLLPELAKKWNVVVLDHRGHGQSERASSYRVIDYARDAVEFVQEEFAEPITVLGHSLGAMVALHMAAELGSKIARVVLEDPPFQTMGRDIQKTPFQSQFAGMQEVARRGLTDIEQITDALAEIQLPLPTGMKRLGDLRDRASLRFIAECLTQVDPEVFTPLIAGEWLDDFDHQSLWSRVRCPALLLQGDAAAGGLFSDVDVEFACDHLQQSRLKTFLGVGHQIHRTRPEEVLTLLDDFAAERA